ncbi:hypothetical protein KIH74_21065 [Kineosporia sp. J2-2]|uniref:histidine kinase n=1 Tax=Kineosporia corallincola TaxID=2835133 RepID=A0ABS5TK39_9ACTN|nr:histidine kinase [Kineosporia corallincola]MBT0771441.1 hypothetical protein [Kineosporia corallincola]
MSSTVAVQARERRLSWAWPAFDLAYLAVMFVTATVREGGRDLPGPQLTGLVLLSWAPLLLRRRHPLGALVAVTLIEMVHVAFGVSVGPHPNANEVMGAFQPVPLATMAAAFTLAARRYGRAGWLPGALAGVTLLLTGVLMQDHALLVTCFVALDLVIIAVGAGVLVSHRRERIVRDERERVSQIRGEVVAERMRIAQDLHDVLAHHLTLVNAQAGVADYLLRSDPDAASGALRDIAGNTRRALDELRATVGMLRQDGETGHPPDDPLRPAPGLHQVDDLLAGFRAAGADLVLAVSGDAVELPSGKDLAAYRIVQEAVTNATKHAPGAPVTVDLHWQQHTLTLRITNPAPPGRPAGHQGPGTRHGLIGMRERAVTVGGTLNAGPVPAGGFAVIATIPLRNEA